MFNHVKESEANLQKQLQDKKRRGGVDFSGVFTHSNPRLYKYQFKLFIYPAIDWKKIEKITKKDNFEKFKAEYKAMSMDGTINTHCNFTYEEYVDMEILSLNDKFSRAVWCMPSMSHAEYLKKAEWLAANKIDYALFSFSRARRDLSNPWDYGAKKWKNYEFAPSFNDDIDELTACGYK